MYPPSLQFLMMTLEAAGMPVPEISARGPNRSASLVPTPEALRWLEAAWRLRAPGLEGLKTNPLLDLLRKEPRFEAIERELKFPN